MLITKAKCKRADSADLKHFTVIRFQIIDSLLLLNARLHLASAVDFIHNTHQNIIIKHDESARNLTVN